MAQRIFVEVAGKRREVDLFREVELGLRLHFHGEQPGAYGLEDAVAEAVEAGNFVGDRRRGGSVNCEKLVIFPHGNGTHTEGVGHITKERIAIGEVSVKPLMAAALLTAPVRRLGEVKESYEGKSQAFDGVICRGDLEQAAAVLGASGEWLNAVVIRVERGTLFSGPASRHSGSNPPYLTSDAVAWLREVGCDHLLVELPSVDREDDGGAVVNHRLFFGVDEEPVSVESRGRTITELIEVGPEVEDGLFVLSLRFPRLMTDAAPSRPVIYPFRDE